MKKITKVQVWALWIQGLSITQIARKLNIDIKMWPGSLSVLHQDIYDGKFDIIQGKQNKRIFSQS